MSDMDRDNGIGGLPTAPHSAPGLPADGSGGKGKRPRGKRTAAVLAICALAGGAAFAVTQAASGSPAAATQAAHAATGMQVGTSASVTQQAATLSGALSGKRAGRLVRLRRLGGMYGQYMYETKTGSHMLAFERGTVTSVSSTDVTVRAANGTVWTWKLTGTSVIRQSGKKVPQSTLATGETVFAGGPVTSGAKDARLIVIRKAVTPPSS